VAGSLANDYSEIKIRLKFAADAPAPSYEVDYNKPPTMPVAIRSVDGQRIPKMMKWGVIPQWAKDDKLAYSTFNARSEGFTTKNGFYEWKKLDPKGKLKQAYAVGMADAARW
jgi:putative SOS response-associated peptidase YedK